MFDVIQRGSRKTLRANCPSQVQVLLAGPPQGLLEHRASLLAAAIPLDKVEFRNCAGFRN